MNSWKVLVLALTVSVNLAFAAQEINKIAAVVNNSVVLENDVENLIHTVKINARKEGQQLPDDKALRHQALERLITDAILLDMAKKMEINIDDQELDQAIVNIANQNQMTADQLYKRLSYEGIDYSTYRNQIRKEMTIAEVRNNEVRRRITILPQEVESLAKQLSTQLGDNVEFNLSHILIGLPENPTREQVEQQEKNAEKLVAELQKGADFGKMAMTYSADVDALEGGQMGWGKLAELPSLFTNQLRTAQKGSIIGPIRSGIGFHILRVNDIRGEKQNISVTEVHARHILLVPSIVMSNEQAKEKLEEISQRLKNGGDFSQLAKEFSEDPGSAAKGGDLGWSTAEVFDPAFRNALLKLSKGEVSKPVHSSFGWHLIQLLDTRQVDRTDAALKDRAYRLLFNRKFAEETQNWLQEERANAYVKIMGSQQQPDTPKNP